MADLDFEELDRAINELYEELDSDEPELVEEPTPAPAPEPEPVAAPTAADTSKKAKQPPVVAEPRPRKVMDMMAPKKKPAIAKSTVAPAVSSTATVAVVNEAAPEKVKVSGKGGHFMDMINPAGDASLKNKPNYAAERQSKIKPVEVVDEPEPAKPSKINITVETDDEPAKKPAPAKTVKVESDVQPVVVDETKTVGDTAKPKTKTTQPAGRRATQFDRPVVKHKVTPLPATDLTPITDEDIAKSRKDPYEVPFLPDAQTKVEKRPLGQPMVTKASDVDDLDKLAESLSKPAVSSVKQVEKAVEKVQTRPTEDKQEVEDDTHEQTKPGRRSRKERDGRPSETSYALKKATKNYNYSQPTRIHRNRGLNILKWILLFIFVIIAGALTGLALYYFGGM